MRDIAELLQLDTFQGMTDEEIESVIAWRVEHAIENGVAAARIEYADAAMQEVLQNSTEAERRLIDSFNDAMERLGHGQA